MIGQKKTNRTLLEREIPANVDVIGTNTGTLVEITKRLIRRVSGKRTQIIIGLLQWNRNHPDELMTYEEYVDYRQQKERKKKQKEIKND